MERDRRYTPITMEVYKRETSEILRCFIDNRISHAECIAALDAALTGLVPRLDPADLPTVQQLIRTGKEVMVKEMRRRGDLSVH